MLNKAANFTFSKEELKYIYYTFVRCMLEHSAVVWHDGHTKKNIKDLERVQKAAVRVIMGKSYKNYED